MTKSWVHSLSVWLQLYIDTVQAVNNSIVDEKHELLASELLPVSVCLCDLMNPHKSYSDLSQESPCLLWASLQRVMRMRRQHFTYRSMSTKNKYRAGPRHTDRHTDKIAMVITIGRDSLRSPQLMHGMKTKQQCKIIRKPRGEPLH